MIGIVIAVAAACVLFAIVPRLAGWVAQTAYDRFVTRRDRAPR